MVIVEGIFHSVRMEEAWSRWFEDEVVIWDVATRQVIGRPTGAGARLLKGVPARSVMGFSPGGEVIVLETRDGCVLWSVSKRGPIGPPLKDAQRDRGRAEPRIRFSPDGRIVASATGAGVLSLAFSASGATLVATTGDPRLLELWDVAHQPARLLGRFDHLQAIRSGQLPTASRMPWSGGLRAVDSQNKMLAFRTGGRLALWDPSSQEARDQPVFVPGFEGDWIAFSPDGATLATCKDAKAGTVITLWEVATLIPPAPSR